MKTTLLTTCIILLISGCITHELPPPNIVFINHYEYGELGKYIEITGYDDGSVIVSGIPEHTIVFIEDSDIEIDNRHYRVIDGLTLLNCHFLLIKWNNTTPPKIEGAMKKKIR